MKVLKFGDKLSFPVDEQNTVSIPAGGIMFRNGLEYRFESERHFLVESVEETDSGASMVFVNTTRKIKADFCCDGLDFHALVGKIVELSYTVLNGNQNKRYRWAQTIQNQSSLRSKKTTAG